MVRAEIVLNAIMAQGADVGVSITSLIGSLGAAGAAVVVVYYFLGFLREMSSAVNTQLQGLATRSEAAQKNSQEQMERLTSRYEQTVREQQLLMRDVVTSLERMTRRRGDPDPADQSEDR